MATDKPDFAAGMEQAEIAYWIPIDRIEPDPDQPRKYFDPDELNELRNSIEENQQRNPIHVRPSPTFEQDQKFIIVAGERRWRGVKALGHERIRAFILATDIDPFVWSFIENYNRSGFNPMEEAMAMARFLNEGMTQVQIAKKIGKSPTHVQQILLLNELPESLQAKVAAKMLGSTVGVILVKECETQEEMAEVVGELTSRAFGGKSHKGLTINKVKSHIERRRQLKKQKESGDTPATASRKELAKCLEPAATALFGLLDELVSLGEESSAEFQTVWNMIPKPQRSGIEATLRSIHARIEKTQTLIDSTK